MQTRISIPLSFALGLLLALAFPVAATAHGVAKFVNGTWFDGTTFQRRDVYSVDGVLTFRYDGHVDRVIDLHGGYVVPPFADAHQHELGNRDPEGIQRYLALGIFYLKNPNSIATDTEKMRQLVNQPESIDVSYALGGITSKGGHPVQIFDRVAGQLGRDPKSMEGNAYWLVDNAQDLADQWPKILAGKPDFIKVYLERSDQVLTPSDPAWYGGHALDPRLVPSIVRRAHAAGLRVTAHVTSAADFRVAVSEGVDEIAHLPLGALTDGDARLAAERNVVVVTTVLSHRPTPAGLDMASIHRENLGRLHAAGVRLAIGTDSHATALDELNRLDSFGVFNHLELLRMLVETTPATIFPGRRIGRLEDGYEANFLVLTANPLEDLAALRHIEMRVKKGHVLQVASPAAAPTWDHPAATGHGAAEMPDREAVARGYLVGTPGFEPGTP